jgi:hypothetical protein
MKIFKGKENLHKRVAGEMLNVEYQRYVFENGVFIEKKPHIPYTTFESDGITTIIKPVLGFIHISEQLSDEKKKFADLVIFNYEEMRKTYFDELGSYYQSYKAVRTSTGNTVIKNKNNASSHISIYYEKQGYINMMKGHEKVPRMSWILCDIRKACFASIMESNFYTYLDTFMFSIICDENFYKFRNNERILKYIDLCDIDLPQTFNVLTINGLVPITRFKQFNELKSKTLVINSDAGFYPSFMKLFNYQMFESTYEHGQIRIHDLNRTKENIFKVPYDKIKIDNSLGDKRILELFGKESTSTNDQCVVCHTPLFDDIYVVFPNYNSEKKDLTCFAVCKTCMHIRLRFSEFKFRMGTICIYIDTDVIAHTKHPTKCAEVLKKIKFTKEDIRTIKIVSEKMQLSTFRPGEVMHIVSKYGEYLILDKRYSDDVFNMFYEQMMKYPKAKPIILMVFS